MVEGYKIVCCTAAGRMRYMKYIFPYVVASHVVDRYDVWVNTVNMSDIEFFKQMAARSSKVRLVWQPDGVVNGISSINRFYEECVAPDTIYIKIDDDVVWMQPGLIDRMVAFRLAHPDALLVTPMVVNNAIASYLWQEEGKLRFDQYEKAVCNHRILWKRGQFAVGLHHWFLDHMDQDSGFDGRLRIGVKSVACQRFSINFILWFGRDMAAIGGRVPGDDEEYLSSRWSALTGRCNLFDGENLVAHFAFGPQREVLDASDVMARYDQLCRKTFGQYPDLQQAWDDVLASEAYVVAHADELSRQPAPLRAVRPKQSGALKRWFKKWQKRLRWRYEEWRGIKYNVYDGDRL